ncbi:alpha/beta hydrolase [Streptomyces sp. NPDC002851]
MSIEHAMWCRVRHSTAVAGALLATVTSMGLSACGGGTDAAGPSPNAASSLAPLEAPDAAGLKRFHDQRPEWEACPGRVGFECATIQVPLDYARPDGDTMRIALNRAKAEQSEGRIGSLVLLPGGPGLSGMDWLFDKTPEYKLRKRFDLVSYDPRGTGRSDPIRCLGDKDLDAFYATDFAPTTAEGRDKAARAGQRYAQSCKTNSARLLSFVGTENNARDVDVIRAVLGEPKLNAMAVSYGTRVAQFYAAQFPGKVGRLVMDSIDNPAGPGNNPDQPEDNAPPAGEDPLEETLRQMVDACVTSGDCALGGDRAAAMKRVESLLADVGAKPLPVSDGRTVGPTLATLAMIAASYSTDMWPDLMAAWNQALREGRGDKLAALADDFTKRKNGKYAPAQAAKTAIDSLAGHPADYVDGAKHPRKAIETLDVAVTEAVKNSPHFGQVWTYITSPSAFFWPVPPTWKPGPIKPDGIPPVLLLNNTGDSATTLADAKAVAKNLPRSVLLANKADDHNVFGKNPCIDRAVEAFLHNGTVPKSDQCS